MSAQESPQIESSGDGVSAQRSFDPAFRRNMQIIGVVVLLAIAGTGAALYFGSKNLGGPKPSSLGSASIPATTGFAGSAKPAQLTEAEEARVVRLQTTAADQATKSGESFIPPDLTLRAQAVAAPPSNSNGPGSNYNYRTGGEPGREAIDPAREGAIKRGLELQLAALLSTREPPKMEAAQPYQPSTTTQQAGTPTSTASAAATAASGSTDPAVLVKGLYIAGGRLVSPLDTAKTDFVSAEISSGPLAGAYLVGKGQVVGDEGVRLKLTRMSFRGEDYPVDVTVLENATSNDALNASIDRQLFSRYVLPVVFSTAAAYAAAISRPAQQVISTGVGTSAVVTPEATAREAAGAGVAAGINKLAERTNTTGPNTAFLPVNYPIGLLFNGPVTAKKGSS